MIRDVLFKYWGYDSFRPGQEDIINSALNGYDTLALMPTGGGKSICFQVPALSREGLCLVISPLIALIKDQVQNLNNRGIKSLAVYSGMSYQQIDAALDNAIYGDYKFLYVSPERLQTHLFMSRAEKMNINFLVVDEAHCISQWGYDFRPAYLEISSIRDIIGNVPTIALTATATQAVADDIIHKLGFGEHKVISTGFERPNLSYVVRNTEDKYGNLLRICNGVQGTGIIYVRERKKSEDITAFLRANNISADFYHAGLSKEMRSYKQEGWKNGSIRVIVATNAFGMGIDKPDVRFVTHYDLPESLEAYFQESGRAGRDGKRSYTTLLWNNSDIQRLRAIHNITYPPTEYIKDIYQKVFIYLNIPYEGGKESVNKFNLQEFARRFSLNSVSAYYAIKYIEQEGYWELTDEIDNPSKIMFTVNRDELYKVQLGNVQLDTFIKSLLRLYTGLFSCITQIDESFIAKTTMDSEAGVKDKLITLSRMHIIKYIPRVRTPLMIMNYERLVESNFYLSKKRYDERKDMFKKRIESVISFVNEENICRSRQLIEYFGQQADNNCGVCDVCLNKKNSANPEQARDAAKKAIIDYFALREVDITKLLHNANEPQFHELLSEIQTMAGDHYKLYLDVFREMIDSSEI